MSISNAEVVKHTRKCAKNVGLAFRRSELKSNDGNRLWDFIDRKSGKVVKAGLVLKDAFKEARSGHIESWDGVEFSGKNLVENIPVLGDHYVGKKIIARLSDHDAWLIKQLLPDMRVKEIAEKWDVTKVEMDYMLKVKGVSVKEVRDNYRNEYISKNPNVAVSVLAGILRCGVDAVKAYKKGLGIV